MYSFIVAALYWNMNPSGMLVIGKVKLWPFRYSRSFLLKPSWFPSSWHLMQLLSKQRLPCTWDVAGGHAKGLRVIFLEDLENSIEEEGRGQPSKFSNPLGRQMNRGTEDSELWVSFQRWLKMIANIYAPTSKARFREIFQTTFPACPQNRPLGECKPSSQMGETFLSKLSNPPL